MYTGSYYFQLAAGVSRTSGALARRRHRSRPTRPPHPSKRFGGDLRADLASQSTAIIRLGGRRHPMAARCVAHRPTRRSAGGLLSMGCWPSPRPLAQAHIDVGEDGRWRPRGEASKRGARQAQSEEAKRQSPEERSRHLFGPNLNKVIGNQPCFPKELRGRFKQSVRSNQQLTSRSVYLLDSAPISFPHFLGMTRWPPGITVIRTVAISLIVFGWESAFAVDNLDDLRLVVGDMAEDGVGDDGRGGSRSTNMDSIEQALKVLGPGTDLMRRAEVRLNAARGLQLIPDTIRTLGHVINRTIIPLLSASTPLLSMRFLAPWSVPLLLARFEAAEKLMRSILALLPAQATCRDGSTLHRNTWGWAAVHAETLSTLAGQWFMGGANGNRLPRRHDWGDVEAALLLRHNRLAEAAALFKIEACGPGGINDLLRLSSLVSPGGAELLRRAKRFTKRQHDILAAIEDTNVVAEQVESLRRNHSGIAGQDLLSIVFMTVRPGGYDVLLGALAQQTSREFELICVDELAAAATHVDGGERVPGGSTVQEVGGRATAIREAAEALGLGRHIRYIGPSDPVVDAGRTPPVSSPHGPDGPHFGIANAMNSGVRRSTGRWVTVLQDFVWIPPTFVQRTLSISRHNPDLMLGYPEWQVIAPRSMLNTTLLAPPWPNQNEHGAPLSVFNIPPQRSSSATSAPGNMAAASHPRLTKRRHTQHGWLTVAPSSMGWRRSTGVKSSFSPDPFAKPTADDEQHGDQRGIQRSSFFECFCCTSPRAAWVLLNGVDETLDRRGSDYNERNFLRRAWLLGFQSAVDLDTVAEVIDHRNFLGGGGGGGEGVEVGATGAAGAAVGAAAGDVGTASPFASAPTNLV